MKATRFLLALFVVALAAFAQPSSAWEWNDLLEDDETSVESLSMVEVSSMRVRDIKRRLARTHGYSADEIGRMLDKKDLINALAFEEHKTRQGEDAKRRRFLMTRGVLVAVFVVVLTYMWPLLMHAWEVASVNFCVYTDKKRHQVKRCLELKSKMGLMGVMAMGFVELIQLWLSMSILLSWVMKSKYFFPTPHIPFRPAQFMGSQVASGPLGGYGINMGPMIVSWLLRFVIGKIEHWTGKSLAHAQRSQKQQKREGETEEQRAARKARKAERKAAREAAKRQQAAWASSFPDATVPPSNNLQTDETTAFIDFGETEDTKVEMQVDPDKPSALDELD